MSYDPQPPNGRDALNATTPWGGISLRGQIVVLVVLFVALAALSFYVWIHEMNEHKEIMRRLDLNACIALYDFEERKAMRKALQMNPKSVTWWCPSW